MAAKLTLGAVLILVCTLAGAQTPAGDRPRRIAFTLLAHGQWDLYASELDGGAMRRLTNDSSREIAPVWSPDGNRLAYSYGVPGGPGVWAGGDRLMVVNHDGTGAKEISRERVIGARFSPDGALLAYSTGQGSSNVSCSYERFTLHISDVVSGAEVMSVSDAMAPVWLPAAEGLLYVDSDGVPRIAVPQSGKTRSLAVSTDPREVGLPITVSPDGRRLYWLGTSEPFLDMLFETDLAGEHARPIIDLPDAGLRLLLSDHLGCYSPRRFVRAWSPSASELLLTRLQTSAPDSEVWADDPLNYDVSLFTLTVVRPLGTEVTFDAITYPVLMYPPGRLKLHRDQARASEDLDGLIREGEFGIADAYWTPDGTGFIYAIGDPQGGWTVLGYRFSDGKVYGLFPKRSPDEIAFIACCGR